MPPANFLARLPRSLSQLLPSTAAARALSSSKTMPGDSAGNGTSALESFDELVEGQARALYRKGQVFYNPAQVVNRDLSVLVLRWLVRQRPATARPLHILEALSATGLRSVRYFREIPSVGHIVANDLDSNAVDTIRRNVLHNGLDVENDIRPNCGDAIEVMSLARSRESRFDVVDLDPYGSAAPFLDAAVQAVADGGLLAVTCTDLAVLCGNSPEICFGRYAATPLKSPTSHEMAVRIVFAAIQTAANRHSRAVEAVFCVKIDFYVRLFVRVKDSKHLAQQTPAHMSMVFQCSECGTQRYQRMGRTRPNPISNTARRKRRRMETEQSTKETSKDESSKPTDGDDAGEDKVAVSKNPVNMKYSPPLVEETISSACKICEGTMLMGGPMWNGPLIGEGVAASLMKEIDSGEGEFKARDRVGALVTLLEEEVRSIPLFMHLPSMCKVLRVCPPPAASVRAVLSKRGYEVSQSHTDPQAIKTNAPPELIWDVLRHWVEKVGSPLTKGKEPKVEQGGGTVKDGKGGKRPSAGERILNRKPALISIDEIDFTVKKDKFVRRGNVEKQGVRFPQNPEPYWGPKARAGKRKAVGNDTTEQPEKKPS